MKLKNIVGECTYKVWIDMLRKLVPEGRTHRLAPLIAGMLQYAMDIAYENYGDAPPEGSVAYDLLMASEIYDPSEASELLSEVLNHLFEDAGVTHERVSSQGDEYSIATSAIYEFIHWYDMPWEA